MTDTEEYIKQLNEKEKMALGATALEAALLAKNDQVAKTVSALGDASQEIQRLVSPFKIFPFKKKKNKQG